MTSDEQHQERGSRLLDTAGATRLLGLKNAGTLVNWRVKSQGPSYVRIGRCIRYRIVDLNSWIYAQRVDPTRQVSR